MYIRTYVNARERAPHSQERIKSFCIVARATEDRARNAPLRAAAYARLYYSREVVHPNRRLFPNAPEIMRNVSDGSASGAAPR